MSMSSSTTNQSRDTPKLDQKSPEKALIINVPPGGMRISCLGIEIQVLEFRVLDLGLEI